MQPLTPISPKKKRAALPDLELQRDRAVSIGPSRKGPSVTEVIPGFLFLGGVTDGTNQETLERIGVQYVLCVAKECDGPADVSTLVYKKISMIDKSRESLRANFTEAFNFLEEARAKGVRILVYCRMGASRSASLVIAYCMTYRSMTFPEALLYVQSKRTVVDPNVGFVSELEAYDEDLSKIRSPLNASPLMTEDELRSILKPSFNSPNAAKQ